MIIDVHSHLGWDYTFDENFTREDLISKLDNSNADIQIVQPGTCHDISQVKIEHDNISKLCKDFPGQFFGMANPNPHLDSRTYIDEISRCIEELGFIAIKIHPLASGINPSSRSGRKVFDAARKYMVPVMVHTGSGIPFAGPVNIIKLAKEYSDLKIIMAHCGQIILANEAETVFNLCPNVYGDTSWTPGFIIRKWISKHGNRIMLGSDHADNLMTELTKISTAGLTDDEREFILSKTAMDVFKLEEYMKEN